MHIKHKPLLLLSNCFCKEVSEVDITSPTFKTSVLKPYLPVNIVPLVGVQTGLDQRLLNRIQVFIMVCNVGILGFTLPIV